MISTLISLSSTETENLDYHEKYGNDLLKDIDLELSFEDLSDALTTTASSFTMASSIGSESIKTMKLNPNIRIEDGKFYTEFKRMHAYDDATYSRCHDSSKRQSKKVCISLEYIHTLH